MRNLLRSLTGEYYQMNADSTNLLNCLINIPFIPNYSEITLEPKVVYVSDEDFSYLFDTNARRYSGTTKQWLEAGGDIDFPKTIGFQVGIIL